jgi:hypothetical protein
MSTRSPSACVTAACASSTTSSNSRPCGARTWSRSSTRYSARPRDTRWCSSHANTSRRSGRRTKGKAPWRGHSSRTAPTSYQCASSTVSCLVSGRQLATSTRAWRGEINLSLSSSRRLVRRVRSREPRAHRGTGTTARHAASRVGSPPVRRHPPARQRGAGAPVPRPRVGVRQPQRSRS